MRHVLLSLVLLLAGLVQSSEAQVRYAILIPIDAEAAGSKKQQLTAVTQGALARMSGREIIDPAEPDQFDRFILTGTEPEIDVRVYIGYEATVGPGVLDVLASLPASITIQAEYAAPINRAEILRRLRIRAQGDGIARAWVLIPGNRTDGFIYEKFVPIGDVTP